MSPAPGFAAWRLMSKLAGGATTGCGFIESRHIGGTVVEQ
jgi:hypothetical protein